MKYNTVTRDIASYSKYVSIPFIQITKRILRTPTCSENTLANSAENFFEIWKNNSIITDQRWGQSHICWTIFVLKIAAKNSIIDYYMGIKKKQKKTMHEELSKSEGEINI